ncbi:MAG: VCBS repeat-containing protein [Deltaproteobacteria bacterium]|nr:VCBS repeat-containing protein [Deltaproteobacteria bacterium]
MKIEQSAIYMSSAHQKSQEYNRTERLEAWIGSQPGATPDGQVDRITLSSEVSEKYSASLAEAQETYGLDDTDTALDPKLSMIKRLIEILPGKNIDITDLSDLNNADSVTDNPEGNEGEADTQDTEGWGVSYDLNESYSETEQTKVSAQGIVRTTDGLEIAFSLNLNMERSYLEQENISIRLGDAARIDPLIINFDGVAAQLTDWSFAFDLNADGVEEEIPFVISGSGILVFDKNSDKQVNNGTELFGPSTGNGFAELAALDEDNNMWIDENDSAYNLLEIWRRDQDGNESLASLAQSGIGAINIGYIDSPFDLTDQDNNLRGQILRTGVYLTDGGAAGSVQQLDAVI